MRNEMNGCVSAIVWFHGMLFVPGLQEVVVSAQPLVPFGKVPERPRARNAVRECNLTSRPATTFGCATATPDRTSMSAPTDSMERGIDKGVLLRRDGEMVR